jgi:N-acetylneuraminate synthase
MADYQIANARECRPQIDMLRELELSRDAHFQALRRCKERGIAFLSSPFDLDSLAFLARDMGLMTIKVPSGEITNGPFLLAVARTGCHVILSTGMAEVPEISQALDLLAWGYLGGADPRQIDDVRDAAQSVRGHAALQAKVTVLHCTSEYPAPFETINLRAMGALADAFGLRIGLSDHSEGIAVPLAAVALGAEVIEKHLTLDRDMPGPDHKASIEPTAFRHMVEGIRAVEAALGDGAKRPVAAELRNRAVARKSLAAAQAVGKGDEFSPLNLGAMRPGSGISPMRYWEYLGRRAARSYVRGDLVAE